MSKKTSSGFSTVELLIILVVIGVLVAFIASKYAAVRQKSRDDQRRSDITSLQYAVQSYFAQTGQYPTADQLNNSSFRKRNIPNLADSALKDPRWNTKNSNCALDGTPVLESFTPPTSGCYGYTVTPANCDNKTTACTGYQLTARLESGSLFSKSSAGNS